MGERDKKRTKKQEKNTLQNYFKIKTYETIIVMALINVLQIKLFLRTHTGQLTIGMPTSSRYNKMLFVFGLYQFHKVFECCFFSLESNDNELNCRFSESKNETEELKERDKE